MAECLSVCLPACFIMNINVGMCGSELTEWMLLKEEKYEGKSENDWSCWSFNFFPASPTRTTRTASKNILCPVKILVMASGGGSNRAAAAAAMAHRHPFFSFLFSPTMTHTHTKLKMTLNCSKTAWLYPAHAVASWPPYYYCPFWPILSLSDIFISESTIEVPVRVKKRERGRDKKLCTAVCAEE